MADRESRWRRSVVIIVTCLLHGGIVIFLVHPKPAYKALKPVDQFLTIFLVKPQPAMAIALPKQSIVIEHQSRKKRKLFLQSETLLPDASAPPVENQTSGDPANIDWIGEARRAAEAISSGTSPGSSDSSVAAVGAAPWSPHPGRLESTPEGVKLRIIDLSIALLHNWTHDPLLGTKGELQLNCNWKKPPPRGDLFDFIRQSPSNQ